MIGTHCTMITSRLNRARETPAHCAARAGNIAALRVLVEGGGLGGILGHMKRLRTTVRRGNSDARKIRHFSTVRRRTTKAREAEESQVCTWYKFETANLECQF